MSLVGTALGLAACGGGSGPSQSGQSVDGGRSSGAEASAGDGGSDATIATVDDGGDATVSPPGDGALSPEASGAGDGGSNDGDATADATADGSSVTSSDGSSDVEASASAEGGDDAGLTIDDCPGPLTTSQDMALEALAHGGAGDKRDRRYGDGRLHEPHRSRRAVRHDAHVLPRRDAPRLQRRGQRGCRRRGGRALAHVGGRRRRDHDVLEREDDLPGPVALSGWPSFTPDSREIVFTLGNGSNFASEIPPVLPPCSSDGSACASSLGATCP